MTFLLEARWRTRAQTEGTLGGLEHHGVCGHLQAQERSGQVTCAGVCEDPQPQRREAPICRFPGPFGPAEGVPG